MVRVRAASAIPMSKPSVASSPPSSIADAVASPSAGAAVGGAGGLGCGAGGDSQRVVSTGSASMVIVREGEVEER